MIEVGKVTSQYDYSDQLGVLLQHAGGLSVDWLSNELPGPLSFPREAPTNSFENWMSPVIDLFEDLVETSRSALRVHYYSRFKRLRFWIYQHFNNMSMFSFSSSLHPFTSAVFLPTETLFNPIKCKQREKNKQINVHYIQRMKYQII